MSSIIGEKDRRIVPRWRPSAHPLDISHTAPPEDAPRLTRISDVEADLEENRIAWEADPSLWNALDYIAGAIVAGKLDEATSAVEQIRKDPRSPAAAKYIIESTGEPRIEPYSSDTSIVEQTARAQIHESRQRLEVFPWDAFAWIDLARGFTDLGLSQKADRSVLAALKLAPNNRFVLRASARFYVYRDNTEKAQYLIRHARSLLSDPWLLASEIALSSLLKRESFYAKDGIKLLKADLDPQDVTELGAAIGTLETDAGNNNKAKKYLRQSLIGANENSVAQIGWLDKTRLGNVIDLTAVNPPDQHEALAWRGFFEGNWNDATEASRLWFQDQPFSRNAAILCTYLLSDISGRHDLSEQTAKTALKCNPRDRMISNNLAYAQIQLGDMKAANSTLSKIAIDDADPTSRFVDATRGLLEFRRGDTAKGRDLYLKAIEFLQSKNNHEQAGRAATYLAIEEVRARTSEIETAVKRSLDLTRDTQRQDTVFKVRELEEMVKKFVEAERSER